MDGTAGLNPVRVPVPASNDQGSSRWFVYGVVLALGLALTTALSLLAWNSAVEAARREFALDALALQARVARGFLLLDDRLRLLSEIGLTRLQTQTQADAEGDWLRGVFSGSELAHALEVLQAQPLGVGGELAWRHQSRYALPSGAPLSQDHKPSDLEDALQAALMRGLVEPALTREGMTLIAARCQTPEVPALRCSAATALALEVSSERLRELVEAGSLAVTLLVEGEGVLGQRVAISRAGAELDGHWLVTELASTQRITLPGYSLRLELAAKIDLLPASGGLLATALLVGGGATLLLVALVRARGEQLRVLAERNAEVSRQVEMQTRELSLARDAALGAARTKAEFLATMSHEIRTPLNAIMGLSELLGESPLTPEQRHYVDVHRRASETLLGLLNDVLDLSKAEAGQLTLAREPFDLSALCEQCVDLFALRAAEKGLLLYACLDPELPEWVLGDPARLRQVLCNLLGNAVKFTDTGEVSLWVKRLESGGERVAFEVRDTGIGVPEDQLEAVFGSFTQVESGASRRHGGTGLGLSICRELVARMQGRLRLDSRLGEGSVFHAEVALPECPGPEVTDSALAAAPGLAREQLARVWVIEPSTGLNQALCKLLHRAGAGEVQGFAQPPDDAVHALPTLLVARLDTLTELHGHRPGVPRMALLEGLTLSKGLARCRELGVSYYAVQPPKRSDVCFPQRIAADAVAVHQATDPSVATADRPERRLLLVDDSEDNRLLVKAFLKSEPWIIDEASDGAMAVHMAAQGRYDLILMDIQMPGMDGYAAAAAVRADEAAAGRPRTPMLALSAHTASEEVARAMASGCDACLSKPLRKLVLLSALAAIKGKGAEVNT